MTKFQQKDGNSVKISEAMTDFLELKPNMHVISKEKNNKNN